MTYLAQDRDRQCNLLDRLDDIPMDAGERARAKAYLRQAESIAGAFIAGAALARRFVAVAQRRAAGLSRAIKSAFVKPARR